MGLLDELPEFYVFTEEDLSAGLDLSIAYGERELSADEEAFMWATHQAERIRSEIGRLPTLGELWAINKKERK